MVTGTKKIQEICDVLKKETLEPAKQEAREVLENAKMQAQEIIEQANRQALEIHENAKKQIEQKKSVFDSSLSLAARQSIEKIKQDIEENLFNPSLKELLAKELKSSDVVTKIIEALLEAINREGTDADVSAYIAKDVDAREVNEVLSKKIKEHLKEKEVLIGDFEGGVKLKLHDQMITIDISDKVVNELVRDYLLDDFREFFFQL